MQAYTENSTGRIQEMKTMIRYEFLKDQNMSAAYDGDTQIGVCQYVVTDQGWAIVHTEVLPEYGGQ